MVKDIEFITVTEITKKAGVNRSTFYLHYENIYELLEETIKNLNDLENNYNITYLYEEQAFVFDDLQEGEYVVVFKYTEEENYAYYSYKVDDCGRSLISIGNSLIMYIRHLEEY